MPRTNTSKIALALARLLRKNSSQQGITLIESLVAITVIAVVITSFTPPIFLAVATRVQNRRAEQALQLAQGEVDRVRRIVEQGSYSDSDLPPIGNSNVRQQSAPNGTTNIANQTTATTGLLIDVNGDGTSDFLVQTFRSQGVPLDGKTVAFELGVRVYVATVRNAFGELDNPPQRPASLRLTTAVGSQRRLPLAMMYTTVVRSDTVNSLCAYRQLGPQGEASNNIACQ